MTKTLKIEQFAPVAYTKSMKITKTDFNELRLSLPHLGDNVLLMQAKQIQERKGDGVDIDLEIRKGLVALAKHHPLYAERFAKIHNKLKTYLRPDHIDSALKRIIPTISTMQVQ